MKRFIGLLLAASLMMVAQAARSETTSVDTKADIQKMATAWMDAYNKKDAATIAKMYADDAVFSNPGWTAAGRAAIEDALNKDLAAGSFSKINSITVEQAHRVGDLDYSAGTWAADTKGADGKEVPVGGHWLVISQYRDGHYVMLVHNSNMALPPPPK
jgi:uncharacterized protein (TIGR02246 family)